MKAAVEAQMAELRAHAERAYQELQANHAQQAQALQVQLAAAKQAQEQLEAASKANEVKLVQALEAEKRDAQRLRKERDQARGERNQDSRVRTPTSRPLPSEHPLTLLTCLSPCSAVPRRPASPQLTRSLALDHPGPPRTCPILGCLHHTCATIKRNVKPIHACTQQNNLNQIRSHRWHYLMYMYEQQAHRSKIGEMQWTPSRTHTQISALIVALLCHSVITLSAIIVASAHPHTKPKRAIRRYSSDSQPASPTELTAAKVGGRALLMLVMIGLCKYRKGRRGLRFGRSTVRSKHNHHALQRERLYRSEHPRSGDGCDTAVDVAALRAYRRGGGMEPGKPSQHRFWVVRRRPGYLDSHMKKLLQELKTISVSKVYNPPGDGLCFWYAITNSLWPTSTTHYARMKNAIRAQRLTIEYVLRQLEDPPRQAALLADFRMAREIGEDASEQALRAQLEHLTSHPQEYHLAVNDLLRQESGRALNCQINWWSVHLPNPARPTIDHMIYGTGRAIHVYYDHAAMHYMSILEFSSGAGYTGAELLQTLGDPILDEKQDIEIQCAVSWRIAQEFHVTWGDCPWSAHSDSITYRKLALKKEQQSDWQMFTELTCIMAPNEADPLLRQTLPNYPRSCPLPAPPKPLSLTHTPVPIVSATKTQSPATPGSQIKTAPCRPTPAHSDKTPERTHLRSQPQKKRQLTLGFQAPPKAAASAALEQAVTPSKPRQDHTVKRARTQPPVPTWTDAAHETPDTVLPTQVGIPQSLSQLTQLAPDVGRPLHLITMNMRSSANMYKIHHLTHLLNDVPQNVDIVVTLQETWLASVDARETLRRVYLGPGWEGSALDRSRPDDPKSGGIMTLVRGGQTDDDGTNRMQVAHEIIDALGITSTRLHRARREGTARTATDNTIILNAYVPTGKNKLLPDREQQLTDRLLGAAKHAGQHNTRVFLTGDWNHLTGPWERELRAMGFKTVAQAGVEIIMVKSQLHMVAAGRCAEVCSPDSELFTDHPLLTVVAPQASAADIHDIETRLHTDIITEHADEFQAHLADRHVEHANALSTMTVPQRMRWASQQMVEIGLALTRTYVKRQGVRYMHYPKKIQTLHDKLRGKIPMGAGENHTQLRKRVVRAVTSWHRRQIEKTLKTRDARFSSDMKRTFRQLLTPPRESLQTLDEADMRAQHTTAAARDDCARRRIGRLWSTQPDFDKQGIQTDAEWQQYTLPHAQDTLAGIDTEVTMHEINQAFHKMSTGKATQSDQISKELLLLAPAETMKLFTDYVQHTFETGTVDEEEGQTDVVLLTKKPNLSAQEITNKRPIALVKFVTKWVQTIIAHRIQARLQHLDNYGFQKQRSTAAAVRKITAILEHARLTDKPAHILTIDIEKAYDTVPFELIEHMLTRHNCPPKLTKLIMQMHIRRDIRFKIEGHIGSPLKPQRGVAQGSPLSCIIFVLCMQPLMRRLQHTASGIWGPQDDVAYVDDLTLLAPTAQDLETKWNVVQKFETWSGMKVNIAKCEYDTTETDKTKWANIPGVRNMQAAAGAEGAVRVLGYWLNAEGDRRAQLQKVITSIRITTNHMKRKLISPEIARSILNMILSARLNYVAQIQEIPLTEQKAILQACLSLTKQQHGLSNPTINAKLFSHPTRGGLGVEDPQNVADRATVAEYVMALNSTKEEYTAAVMRDNIKRIEDLAHNIKPIPRRTGKNTHTITCQQTLNHGGQCTCCATPYHDMMHAQAGRCAARLGVTIQDVATYDNGLQARAHARDKKKHNGKQHAQPGEFLYLRHKQSGDQRLATLYETLPADNAVQLGLTWVPRLGYSNGKQGMTTIVGDNTHFAKKGLPINQCYITAREVEKAYQRRTLKKSEILRRISQQWDTDSRITTLSQIPGILTTWVEDPENWIIRRAEMSSAELTISKRTKKGTKRWKIDVRVLERLDDTEIHFDANEAYAHKSRLKHILSQAGAQTIEAWTDGSKLHIDDQHAYSSGMHVEVEGHPSIDLACRVTGVSSVMGAELAPVAKLLKWCHPANHLKIYTDSQATIDAWTRITTAGYRDRELTNHAERNALCSIIASVAQKQELTRNVSMQKVTSHTGVLNNEKADILAGLGARGQHGIWIHIKSGQRYLLTDAHGAAVMGNLRKSMRQVSQDAHCARWEASEGPQGVFARAIHQHNLRRASGPNRKINSHKKYLREINSIQQQQHKWTYGHQTEARVEHKCKLCGAKYGSAAHRLFECNGRATELVLAKLKYNWTRTPDQQDAQDSPRWMNDMRDPAALDWVLVKGARLRWPTFHWMICHLANEKDHTPHSLPPDQRTEVINKVAEALSRLKHSRRVNLATTQREGDQHIQEAVVDVLLAPAWIPRALLTLGIYTEHTDNLLLATGWQEKYTVVGTPQEEHLSSLPSQGGGHFRSMLNASSEELKTHSRGLLAAVREANERKTIFRYTTLAMGDDHMQQYVKSNGGKLLAVWHPGSLACQCSKWLIDTDSNRQHLNELSVFLAMWETEQLDTAWGIPQELWTDLVQHAATEESCPELRGSWDLTRQVRQHLPAAHTTPRDEHGGYSTQATWAELTRLERHEPFMFWASRIPQLHTRRPNPEPENKRTAATVTVTVNVAGHQLTKKLPIDELKLPKNAARRKELREAAKAAKKAEQRWYAQLEEDIWVQRRYLHTLQSKLLAAHFMALALAGHTQWQRPRCSKVCKKRQRNGSDRPIEKRPKVQKSDSGKGTKRTRPEPLTIKTCFANHPKRSHPNPPPDCTPPGSPQPPPQYKRARRTREQWVAFLDTFKYQLPPGHVQNRPP